jgi:hypothetical protein
VEEEERDFEVGSWDLYTYAGPREKREETD